MKNTSTVILRKLLISFFYYEKRGALLLMCCVLCCLLSSPSLFGKKAYGGGAAGAQVRQFRSDRREWRLPWSQRGQNMVENFLFGASETVGDRRPHSLLDLCQYGITFVSTIFVGHLGDVQLSTFSIATSVIGNFAYGFLVSYLNYSLISSPIFP